MMYAHLQSVKSTPSIGEIWTSRTGAELTPLTWLMYSLPNYLNNIVSYYGHCNHSIACVTLRVRFFCRAAVITSIYWKRERLKSSAKLLHNERTKTPRLLSLTALTLLQLNHAANLTKPIETISHESTPPRWPVYALHRRQRSGHARLQTQHWIQALKISLPRWRLHRAIAWQCSSLPWGDFHSSRCIHQCNI